jgi:hypothetical protein
LSFTAEIQFVVPFSTTVPAPPKVGVVVPPVLLKLTLPNVLFPVSVSVPPPLIVTLLVEAIAPLFVFNVAAALSNTRLPGT